MPMLNPPHPGEVIRGLCLAPLNLSVAKAAEGLGVARGTLSQLLNGHSGISPKMALRLSSAFGGSPESWMQQQALYDLAQARKEAAELQVKRFKAA